jgi:imidazolonepropionase-like amidohydrolase
MHFFQVGGPNTEVLGGRKLRHILACAVALAAIGTAALAAPALAPPAQRIVAPPAATLGPITKPYVKMDAGLIVLKNVMLIDGTGAPAKAGQTIILNGSNIQAIGANLAAPSGAKVLDLTGYTVMPGIVGMHNHMFYIAPTNLDATGHSEQGRLVPQMTFSAPRLYLANGVTTMRTTGSMEPYADLRVKKDIDAGLLPGPHMDVTGPYVDGATTPFTQIHQMRDAEDAKQFVNYWADQGITSLKLYMNLTRDEAKTAIEEAHKRGLKVTGHLCSVSYPEAVAMGIDNLEHGFTANSQLFPNRKPDICNNGATGETLRMMQPNTPEADALIKLLVDKHVAITSTLPVSEQGVPGQALLEPRVMDAMTPEARTDYLYNRNLTNSGGRGRGGERGDPGLGFRTDMALQRKFVAAGGLLMNGPDPTGNGGIVAGFGDQRGIELLVQAGFSPVEAIKIATLNGAIYMGVDKQVGSIAVGKTADLLVAKGDLSTKISDIKNTEIVFKDGVGYDPAKLLAAVRGNYGRY